MVNEWAGRIQDGWDDGKGIYEISLAHPQRALQLCQLPYKYLLFFYSPQHL